MENIQNIIFDLGGVIMDIDVRLTMAAFTKLGVDDIHRYFGHGFAASFFSDHEAGRISDEIFLKKIKDLLGGEIGDEAIIEAWNALLLRFPPDRIALLKQIKSRYRTFLYSNTNAIHYTKFSEIYKETIGGALEDNFEKAYFSHVLGQRKPETEGFSQILLENGLDPTKTIFVDDAWINVEAAIKAGMKGLYMPPGFYITDIRW